MELDVHVFVIHLASRLSMSCVKEQARGFAESPTCTSPNPGIPVIVPGGSGGPEVAVLYPDASPPVPVKWR